LAGAVGLIAAGCGGGETKTTTTTAGGSGAKGDPVAGKVVFTGSGGCTGCHTLADAGSTAYGGPNLDQSKPSYARVIARVTDGFGEMPPFIDLSKKQIRDVAAYVSSVAGK
jgi:mono/diheme cytochrome c family protein